MKLSPPARHGGTVAAPATTPPRQLERAAVTMGEAMSLSAAISRLALLRFETASVGDALRLVTRVAVDVTPGATGATLHCPEGAPGAGRPPLVVATDDRFLELESVHSPSVDAMASGDPVSADGDMTRWPAFAGVAVRLEVCDVLAAPLSVGRDRHACLSIYSHDLFGPQARLAVEVLAQHASVTVANALAFSEFRVVNDQLSEGMRSREIIGLAKGILMRQERCSEADAFRMLVSSSQRLQLKVREVARHVVALAEGRSDLPRERHD